MNLNARPEILKLLEENTGEMLEYISTVNEFLGRNQKAQNKAKIDTWDCSKVKNFCMAVETIKSEETTWRMGKNISHLFI
jgi:hypothetical protein